MISNEEALRNATQRYEEAAACALAEALPKELFSPMPLIRATPIEREREREQGEAQELFACPVYKTQARAGNFVVMIDLPAGAKSPEHWVKAGAACFGSHGL